MKQAWYGPLVELAAIASHVGCHAQLVVFILQSHPPEKVRTSKGKELQRSILYVGDSSCAYVKVSLWNHIGSCHEISAGDIIFLQNFRVVKFRSQMELTSAQFSEIVPLLKRQDIFSAQVLNDALTAWQHGPLLKEQFRTIVSWAQKTQQTFLSLLSRVARMSHPRENTQDMRGDMNNLAPKVEEIRKCSSIMEALSVGDHCVAEFYATIGEIFFTSDVSTSSGFIRSHDGCLLFSKNLYGNEAEGLLKELVCVGCEMCGRVLGKDKNRIYEGCRCAGMPPSRAVDHRRAKQKQACRIFRPFFLHVEDRSTRATVLVKHDAAVRMFGNISADRVFRSLQGTSPVKGMAAADGDDDKGGGEEREPAVEMANYGLLLTILLRRLLSTKNSPLQVRVVCDPSLRQSSEFLRLASISLPVLT